MAAVKPEVVLAEWLCAVTDGFSDCYACLCRDILILCCWSCWTTIQKQYGAYTGSSFIAIIGMDYYIINSIIIYNVGQKSVTCIFYDNFGKCRPSLTTGHSNMAKHTWRTAVKCCKQSPAIIVINKFSPCFSLQWTGNMTCKFHSGHNTGSWFSSVFACSV